MESSMAEVALPKSYFSVRGCQLATEFHGFGLEGGGVLQFAFNCQLHWLRF